MPAEWRTGTRLRAAASVMLIGFVGGTGGASSIMQELADAYEERGVHTRIVVPVWDGTLGYAAAAEWRGLEVERSRSLNMEHGWRRSILDAMRFIHAHRAPVVHYHLSDNYLEPAFLRAMDLLRPPRAFASMHSPFDEPSREAPEVRAWVRGAPRHFQKVICVSSEGRERQLRYGIPAGMTTLIRNGVNVERFSSGDACVARQALTGVPADAPLVLSTARLDEQKQPLTAVVAFARVATEFPSAHLVMVGRGPLEDATRAAAEQAGLASRVHLVGHQTNVPDWLAAATVWVLPTLSEGFSLGVIEAMAAGCTIVSTRCPGNDEVLVDDENALVVPVGAVETMASALRRALSDPGLRGRLGAAARATASRHSLAAVVDRYLECYGLTERERDVA